MKIKLPDINSSINEAITSPITIEEIWGHLVILAERKTNREDLIIYLRFYTFILERIDKLK